jgi:hypothetical protein
MQYKLPNQKNSQLTTTRVSDLAPTQNFEYVSTTVALKKKYIFRKALAVHRTVPKYLVYQTL